MFAQFWIILHNLGEFRQKFAYFCLLLHYFARFFIELPKTSPKNDRKNTPKKGSKKSLKIGSERHKTTPQRCQNYAKMISWVTPKWPESTRRWSKIIPKWPTPSCSQKTVKNIDNNGRTVQKPSRPLQRCIKTLRIHTESFHIHPRIAHVHRLKRRFRPGFKQTKCFVGEKRHMFAQFCIILYNLDEFLQKFSYFCCLLLHHFGSFCIELPGLRQKTTTGF